MPDRAYLLDLRRPWKLLTFAIGMSWLIYGVLNYGFKDWDVGVSVLMGGLTYLCAPWTVRTTLIPVFRHTSFTGMPASACFKLATICVSLNRDFFV